MVFSSSWICSNDNEENEQRVSSAQERSQKNEESKIANNPDWEAEKPTESSNEVSTSE